jgi:hypothetical protein
MAPPAAGPDRALDAPRPAGAEEDVGAVVEVDEALADGDDPQPANSTITAHIAVAATIHRPLGFESNRRAFEFVGSRWFMMRVLLLTHVCSECERASCEPAVGGL